MLGIDKIASAAHISKSPELVHITTCIQSRSAYRLMLQIQPYI